MQLTDAKVHPDAGFARHLVDTFVTPATSLTNRAVNWIKPGHGFLVEEVAAFASTVAGTVTFQAWIAGAADIIVAPTFSTHSTAEQVASTICRYTVGGKFVEKAAATGITFTANHVVTASLWGIILFQIDNAGTITTKVPAATPTTAMVYTSAANAVAALPSADSGKLALGYVIIANNTGDWTANTDDLTNGSDVTTATYVSLPVTAQALLASALTPVAFERTAATLSTTLSNLYTRESTDGILLLVTTDGSGALTNGHLQVAYRPFPLAEGA